MASNSEISIPGFEDYKDWIEIFNNSSSEVNISGYYITDKFDNPTKRQLPNSSQLKIPAFGYLVLYCDGDPSNGPLHVDLSLSAAGEQIGLYMPDGVTLVDAFSFDEQITNISMGRDPNNLNQWLYFKNPTPGGPNDLNDSYSEIMPAPTFSHPGGFYPNPFSLYLSTDVSGGTIYYTLDGSEPDPNNTNGTTFKYVNEPGGDELYETFTTETYTESISIYNRSSEPNHFSTISSSYLRKSYFADSLLYDPNFYFPTSPIKKGTVVKAIVHNPGALSNSKTSTYFVSEQHTFPTISIALSPDHLFDYEYGFYTAGKDGDGHDFCDKGNFNQNLKYPGSFEYFTGSVPTISENIKFEIHGGCTRGFPQKSLKLYGKNKFEYPFFSETPEIRHSHIILRNGGNNWYENIVKDVINHKVMEGLNFGLQHNEPTIVYLNGEYWGIHNMREKIDRYYINSLFGINENKIDMLKTRARAIPEAKEGDKAAYNDMMLFIQSNSFSNSNQTNYDSLLNLIDMDSFIDYFIAETYLNNPDWPNNNLVMWRYKASNFNPNFKGYKDGRWRWVLYDTDEQISHEFNMLDILKNNVTHENALIFQKVVNNTHFKNQFTARHSDLLNTNFKLDQIMDIINITKSQYDQEMASHQERWQRPKPGTWADGIQKQKDYFTNKNNIIRSQIQTFFSLGNPNNLTVNVSNPTEGYVKVNTIDILASTPGISSNPYPWTGKYFKGVPTVLTAKSLHGFKFSHWLRDNVYYSSTSTISFDLNTNRTFKAVFEINPSANQPFPEAAVLNECGYSFSTWSKNSQAGNYPANMSFVYFIKSDPDNEDHFLEDELGGLYPLTYKEPSKNRIDGLGEQGISFINTGSDLDGILNAKLGGAILALNTENQDDITISWTGGTILKNNRKYRLRLQYRVNDLVDFQDLLDQNGQIIEYKTQNDGHHQRFEDIPLPQDALNRAYVQILWRYYYAGTKTSGKRSQLRLDDIHIKTSASFDQSITQSDLNVNREEINSRATVIPSGSVNYTSSQTITLNPGFNTTNGVVFKAQIKLCD